MARLGRDILREELKRGTKPEVWVRFPRQLGDVVFTLPFFGTLRADWDAVAAEEGCTLKWIAVGHAIGAALFSEADPAFIAESVIESGGQGKPDPWHLLRRWKKDRPVAVINLSQSVRLTLAAWMAGVPIRAGIADNRLSMLYTHPFRYRNLPLHCSQRFAPLLEKLTGSRTLSWWPLSPSQLGGGRSLEALKRAGWTGGPYVTLAFGTRGYGKRWFPEDETWPALARLIQEQGVSVVWIGGPDEAKQGEELAARVPGSFNLAGQTTIPEVVALQHAAWGNVAIDTGLAHTAAGTGHPTVTIINDSMESLIGPVGPHAVIVRGAPVDVKAGTSPGFLPERLGAHRIEPQRIWALLQAMVREASETEGQAG